LAEGVSYWAKVFVNDGAVDSADRVAVELPKQAGVASRLITGCPLT